MKCDRIISNDDCFYNGTLTNLKRGVLYMGVDVATEYRFDKATWILATAMGMRPRLTSVDVVAMEEFVLLSFSCSIAAGSAVLVTKSSIDLSDVEDEEEAVMVWMAEIATMFTMAARSLGLSENFEYSFARTDIDGPWCFEKVPVMDFDDDGPFVVTGSIPSGERVTVVGETFPESGDLEAWKVLIWRLGIKVFGYK